MIYSQFGAPVTLTEAKLETWYSVERTGFPFELRRVRPKRVSRNMTVTPCQLWFVRCCYANGQQAGQDVVGGAWLQAGQYLRADGGWGEIEDACKALMK